MGIPEAYHLATVHRREGKHEVFGRSDEQGIQLLRTVRGYFYLSLLKNVYETLLSHHNHRVSQYRYQLKKWGIKKRTTEEEKNAIVSVLGKRMRSRSSTGDITMTNQDGDMRKEVDKRQLNRFLHDHLRHHQDVSILPGV